jgi:hypothetical protein
VNQGWLSLWEKGISLLPWSEKSFCPGDRGEIPEINFRVRWNYNVMYYCILDQRYHKLIMK